MAPLALVTGTSTGIGRATALHLAARGFEVLAGVRRPEDAPSGLEPVVLDVTSERDVAAAAERVGGSLDALVNNAGIAVNGPVELVPGEEWRRQLEVNLIGQVAVTRALLPALLAARGRIVNVSSISGRAAWPLIGPYTASKFALEAFSNTLRREVGPQGVHVVSVEPGGIRTPVWDKSREEAVASVIGAALTARRPRARYVVGREAQVQALLARLLPDRAFDALVARALRPRR